MIDAVRLKMVFSDGIELDTTTALRKLKTDFNGNESALAEYFDCLCKDGILVKSIAFLDPSNFSELVRFNDEMLINTYQLSKNRLRNKMTGSEYDLDCCHRINYYRLANPDYVYNGVEHIEGYAQVNAFIFGCDTVSFAKEDTEDQVAIYQLLTKLISETLNSLQVPPENVVCIPTGDGYFVVMNNCDPYLITCFAHDLSTLIFGRRYNIPLRCGIHYGSVYMLKHKNGRVNVIGHSLNKCARIMGFGNEKHILVSEEYYKSFIDHTKNKFSFREIPDDFSDKHGYPHRIYTYCKDSVGNSETPTKE